MLNGFHEANDDDDDCWSESSTLSNEESNIAKYSAAAASVAKPYLKVAIVPKERKGEIFQALTMAAPLKNALEDIGHTVVKDDLEQKKVLAPKNPFENCSDDDDNNNDNDHDDDKREENEVNDRTLRSNRCSRDQGPMLLNFFGPNK